MSNFKVALGKNLKPYMTYIPEMNKNTMRSLVKLCVAFLENQKYSKELYDREVVKLSLMNPDGPKNYDFYCTVVMILLETFLKTKKSGDDQHVSEVLKDLKFQNDCVEDLSKVLISNQHSLYEHFQLMKLTKPIKSLEYRINISLVESGQQPTIILHIESNDGIKTLNLPLQQFHRLRLAIASALSEVRKLEGKR